MSSTKYGEMAKEKLSESSLWEQTAVRDLERVRHGVLLIYVLRRRLALESRLSRSERSRLEMALIRLEAGVGSRIKHLPALWATANSLRTEAIIYQERDDNREWAELQEEKQCFPW